MTYPAMHTVRRGLTGSIGGTGIKISSISSGVELHTHDSTLNESQFDELHLWAYNSHTSAVTLTLQWGGTTSPDNLLPIDIGAGSLLKIVDGLHIGGDLAVNAIAGSVDKIMVYGYALSHVQDKQPEADYGSSGVVYHYGYDRHK